MLIIFKLCLLNVLIIYSEIIQFPGIVGITGGAPLEWNVDKAVHWKRGTP